MKADFIKQCLLAPMRESGVRYAPQVPILAENAWYDSHSAMLRVTTSEEWEWGSLQIDFDCGEPPENHWLSWELEGMGSLSDVMGLSVGGGSATYAGSPQTVEQLLLEEGIAPGQPFWIEMTWRCYQAAWYDDNGGTEVDWKVLNSVCWDPERVATAWEAFLGRKMLICCL